LGSFAIAYAVSAGPEWTLQAFVVASMTGNLATLGLALFLVSRDPGSAARSESTLPVELD
jgi:hypothetical protein